MVKKRRSKKRGSRLSAPKKNSRKKKLSKKYGLRNIYYKNHHAIALLTLYLILLMIVGILWHICPDKTSRVGRICCIDTDQDEICDEPELPKEETKAEIIIGAQVSAHVYPKDETEKKYPFVEEPVQIKIYEVGVDLFKFEPEKITIPKGSTVIWENKDTRPHVVSAHYGEFRSPRLMPGDTYTFKFETAGKYTYVDSIFPQANGEIVVE